MTTPQFTPTVFLQCTHVTDFIDFIFKFLLRTGWSLQDRDNHFGKSQIPRVNHKGERKSKLQLTTMDF